MFAVVVYLGIHNNYLPKCKQQICKENPFNGETKFNLLQWIIHLTRWSLLLALVYFSSYAPTSWLIKSVIELCDMNNLSLYSRACFSIRLRMYAFISICRTLSFQLKLELKECVFIHAIWCWHEMRAVYCVVHIWRAYNFFLIALTFSFLQTFPSTVLFFHHHNKEKEDKNKIYSKS